MARKPAHLPRATVAPSVIASALCLFAINPGVANAATPEYTPSVRLSGHNAALNANVMTIGHLSASEPMSLALTLKPRDQEGLDTLLNRIYNPKDSLYHKYLTSQQFVDRFSPTEDDYHRLMAYAKSQGLTITGTHPNRLVLDVAGSASNVEQAFGVRLNQYRTEAGKVFYSANADPAVPVSIAPLLNGVMGLDNTIQMHAYAAQVPVSLVSALKPFQIGSGPNGGLAPSDIKTAYNLNNLTLPGGQALNGSGQVLGMFQLDGYRASDIAFYASYFHLGTVPTLQNVLVDGVTNTPGAGAGEVTLDIELQMAMAPGASKIIVYEGPNTGQGIIDTYNRIATDNQAKQISSSWGLSEGGGNSTFHNMENTIFQQMAAQGQTIYAASGDAGAYDNGGSTLCVDDPAAQPYMTGVGGTQLFLNSDKTFHHETAWNRGAGSAGGGGISAVWSKPSWQSGLGSSTTMRNVPDVSLDGDPYTGYAIYFNGSWTVFGGTSCASPLWGGFTALVNQQRVANGLDYLGFANPSLYTIGKGSNYNLDFNDVLSGSTNLFYATGTGYDNATGWGSFNGANLIAELSPGTSAPAAPTGIIATPGDTQITLTWSASIGGGTFTVKRSSSATGTFTTVASGLTSATYTNTGLTNGTTYYYVVSATNSIGESANSGVVSATPVPLPGAPTGVTATAGVAQVVLAWTGSSGSTYNVKRNLTGTGTFTTVASGLTAATYTNTGLTNGTKYYYVVTAVNGVGESGNSSVVNATPLAKPAVPLGLTAQPGNTQVILTWTAGDNTSKYNVKRTTDPAVAYTTIASNVTAATYTDTGLTNGTTYYYVVSAVNTAAESANSSRVAATPLAAPSVPTSLTATAGVSKVALAWTGSDGSKYNIKRGLSASGPFDTIVTKASATTYNDTTVTNGTTYYYTISAVNTTAESANSSVASATPLARPEVVLGLTAQPGDSQVVLTWTLGASTSKYNVKRTTDLSAAYTTIATNVTSATYTNTGLTNGTTYYYVVSAVNPVIEGSNSSRVSGTPYEAPNAPSALTATAGIGKVTLAWTGNDNTDTTTTTVTGVCKYNIKRGLSASGPFDTIVTKASSSTYNDTTVTNGTTYYYTITAVNTTAESANSNVASAKPLSRPTAPQGLTAQPGDSQVVLTWTLGDSTSKYNVKRTTDLAVAYTTIASNVTVATYTDTGLTNGTTYYYVVSAVNPIVEGPNSSRVAATPYEAPNAPSALTATAGIGKVTLAWTGNDNTSTGATITGVCKYNIKRGLSASGPFDTIVTKASSTTYNDTTVTNGTTYYYVVTAVNTTGESANSNVAHALPLARPNAPQGLTAQPGDSQVVLTWTLGDSTSKYNVKRTADLSAAYTTIATNVTAATYIDTGLTNGTTYYYVVSAVNSVIEGSNSSRVAAIPYEAPNAPSALTATAGIGKVTLAWTGNDNTDATTTTVTGVCKYNIKRGLSASGPFTTIVTKASSTTYNDTTVTNGTTYYYVVTAINTTGESANSNVANATPMAKPATPTGLVAHAGNTQIVLTWTAGDSSSKYNVKRTTDLSVAYTTVGTNVTSATYTDTGLTNGTLYYYVVSSVNAVAESSNSTRASATPATPGSSMH